MIDGEVSKVTRVEYLGNGFVGVELTHKEGADSYKSLVIINGTKIEKQMLGREFIICLHEKTDVKPPIGVLSGMAMEDKPVLPTTETAKNTINAISEKCVHCTRNMCPGDPAICGPHEPRISFDPLDMRVAKVTYTVIGNKTTICLLTTKEGFEIVGTSACVNPTDFNLGQGRYWALKNAKDKLEKYEGYLRQQELAAKSDTTAKGWL